VISARLNVSGVPTGEDDEPTRDEEGGVIGLASAPSAGDMIHLLHGSEFQLVRVARVIHYAVTVPPPQFGRENPFIEIEADWVAFDLSQYAQG